MEPRFDFDANAPGDDAPSRRRRLRALSGEKCYVPLGAEAEHVPGATPRANGDGASAAFVVDARHAGSQRRRAREEHGSQGARDDELGSRPAACRASNPSRRRARCDGASRESLARRARRDGGRRRARRLRVRARLRQGPPGVRRRRSPRSRRSRSCSPRWRSRSTPRGCSSGRRRGSSTAARTPPARRISPRRYAADMALKVTDNAVQVLGGHGYIRDHLVELCLRNARGFAVVRRTGDRLTRTARRRTTMIDFELSPDDRRDPRADDHMLAEQAMRPISREYDEREHEKPWDFINMMWQLSQSPASGLGGGKEEGRGSAPSTERNLRTVRHHRGAVVGRRRALPEHPRPRPRRRRGRGGRHARAEAALPRRASRAASRSGRRWRSPSRAAAPTRAAITTTAVRDGDQWVLNGTKIFCTSGHGGRPDEVRTASSSSGRRSTSRPAAPASRPSSSTPARPA